MKLKDSLMSSVVFSQAKDAELAWIDGEIHFSSVTSKTIIGQEEPMNGDDSSGGVPVLDVMPHADTGRVLSINLLQCGILMLFSIDQRLFKCVYKSTIFKQI